MTTTEAYIVLNLIPKIGPVRVRRMLDALGTPEAILEADPLRLMSADGIGEEIANSIATWQDHIDLSRELRRISETKVHVITQESREYPKMLKEIYDPPIVLYVRGKLEERDRHSISVVGSRRATHYGIQAARKLSFQMAHAGLTVVSGLARGIDTAAHEGALAANGRTVAVIGSGLGQLYPPENETLAERIESTNAGAVVSQFPIDYPPDKQSFPLRNRIVAGWGHGVLVVEAPKRSGSLITANQAADQGRAVYAIPGQIDRPSSHGANALIQNGARLVMDASDILDDMSILLPAGADEAPVQESPTVAGLSPEEQAVYEALGTAETVMDDIISRTKLPAATVSSNLLRLEMKRLVKQLPGNHYVKLI